MRLHQLLGTEFPIIQGGMANIATGRFAAACSNAGAMGIVAAGGLPPEVFREEIRLCRSLTDKPFGVNIMLMHPEVQTIAQIAAEEKVPFITSGAGNPAPFIPAWKEAGAMVFPVVAAVAVARIAARAGADGVIAEGMESGGHIGEATTMALVPRVVDAVDLPVVAAGGIATGRQMLAAFALGACGVQVGTCLLTSKECPIHENYKAAILAARDSSTVITGRSVGAPVRCIKNPMTHAYLKMEQEGVDKARLEELTLGSLRRAVFEGDVKQGSLLAGQVAGMAKEILPLRTIFETLCHDCDAQLAQLKGVQG